MSRKNTLRRQQLQQQRRQTVKSDSSSSTNSDDGDDDVGGGGDFMKRLSKPSARVTTQRRASGRQRPTDTGQYGSTTAERVTKGVISLLTTFCMCL